MNGAVDWYFVINDEHEPELQKEFVVRTINPGKFLGIASVSAHYQFTATGIAINDSNLLEIDAVSLREHCKNDTNLNCDLQGIVAKATIERLQATRVHSAAATSSDYPPV